MFKKTLFSIAILIATTLNLLYSQTDTSAPVDTIQKDTFWKIGGDIGLNFNQILFINPRVGSGDNRIGFGGLMNLFATYKKDKFIWANSLKLQYAVQRLGENSAENPFEKTLDNIRFGTALGYKAFNDKTYWAFDATFESQLSKTYPGNFLNPIEVGDQAISNFMSPATIVLSPGIGYTPTEQLTFFLSPASFKTILVLDDLIAQLGVHGNEPIDRDDLSKGYKNSFNQFGASFKALYNNKFAKDRILVSTELNLYSNYLFEPQNVDVYWNFDLGLVIWKNISINVVTNLYYDHDIFIPDDKNNDGEITEGEGGPRTTFTEALVIKYNYTF
jgi:Protein of unknown function (DUF3078)